MDALVGGFSQRGRISMVVPRFPVSFPFFGWAFSEAINSLDRGELEN